MPNAMLWYGLACSLARRASRRDLPEAWKRRVLGAVQDAEGDLDRALRPLLSFVRRHHVATRTPPAHDAWQVLAPKAVAAAFGALTGDWSRVAPHERAAWHASALFLRAHMGAAAPVQAPPAPVRGAGVVEGANRVIVPFAHAWVPIAASKGVAMGMGHVPVARIDPAAVPVACRLHVPFEPGTPRQPPLAVRRHGDAWLRPVLAPGGWEPASLQAFADAAAIGAAWVDDPFAQPALDGIGVVGVADHAKQTRVSAADAAERDAAMRACIGEAGPLYLVDDVVHRTCPPPVLAVFGGSDAPGVTWTLGNLRGTGSMDTVMGAAGRHGPVSPGADPFARKVLARFPLVDATLVESLVRGTRHEGGLVDPGPIPNVLAWADPGLLPTDPVSPLRAFNAWLTDGRGPGWFGMPDMVSALDALVRAADLGYLDEDARVALMRMPEPPGDHTPAGSFGAALARAAKDRVASMPGLLPAEPELAGFVP